MSITPYKIYLDNHLLGTTLLEKADPPMGVVTGHIEFINLDAPYQFFKNYCLANDIAMVLDDYECKLICTTVIDSLHIYNSEGVEVAGVSGNYIEGMEADGEGFSIIILGIEHCLFESEFLHHYEQYEQHFK